MKTIKEGTQVKYIGKTNYYTFKNDISENSTGIVKKVTEFDGRTYYEVEFENGIIASIDLNYLEKIK